nr:uncharacterized protein LOC113820697 [Penaeus vannamei]
MDSETKNKLSTIWIYPDVSPSHLNLTAAFLLSIAPSSPKSRWTKGPLVRQTRRARADRRSGADAGQVRSAFALGAQGTGSLVGGHIIPHPINQQAKSLFISPPHDPPYIFTSGGPAVERTSQRRRLTREVKGKVEMKGKRERCKSIWKWLAETASIAVFTHYPQRRNKCQVSCSFFPHFPPFVCPGRSRQSRDCPVQHIKMSLTLTSDLVAQYQEQVESEASSSLAMNACWKSDPLDMCLRRNKVVECNHIFTHKVENEGRPVTNQKSSGRCWIFACLNVMRIPFMKACNIDEFEFSQAYLFFWDKIERCNYFLNKMVECAKRGEEVEGRLVSFLLHDPISDGGQWDMLVNLITK